MNDGGFERLNTILNLTGSGSENTNELHPEMDHLISHYLDQLPEHAHDQVKAHLVACPQCTTVLAEIARLLEGLPPDSSPQDAIIVWEGFLRSARSAARRKNLPEPTTPLEQQKDPVWRRAPKGYVARRSMVRIVGIVCFIALLLGGAGVHQWWRARKAESAQTASEQRLSRMWDQMQAMEQENQGLRQTNQGEIASLTQRVKELSGPRLNWPVYDAFSAAFLRRTGGPAKANEIEIPPSAGGLNLILNPDSQVQFPDYRAEIVNGSGEIVWQGEGLQRNRLDSFNMSLNRELLPQGLYTIKVYGKSGTKLSLLGEFPILLKQPPRTPPNPVPSAQR
jgi:hypothetical protein